jgi:hypothetical protein
MKRSMAFFLAILVIVPIAASVMSMAAANTTTPTPRPPASISPMPLPFSGGTNSISGTVFDASGNGIPMAKVTLYYTVWVGNDYKAKDPVRVEGIVNPQFTSDGSMSPAGLYVYTNIPSGVYVLTAEKGGISVSKNIMVTGGTTTENLFIQGYIEDSATPTPSRPTTTITPTIKPTTVPAGTQKPGIESVLVEVLKVMLMGIVGVQLVVSVVVIALQVGRRR